jgi:hypothetical protein
MRRLLAPLAAAALVLLAGCDRHAADAPSAAIRGNVVAGPTSRPARGIPVPSAAVDRIGRGNG